MKTGPFHTTRWTLVDAFQNGDSPEALEELVRSYLPAVRVHFTQRFGAQDVDDLAQSFIATVVLQRGLFSQADRSKGRLRSLLRTALDNYVIDVHRRGSTRRAGNATSVDPSYLDQAGDQRSSARGEPDAFDREWARTLLEKSVDQCETSCRASTMDRQWQAFEMYVVRPARMDTTRPTMKRIAADLGFSSAEQAFSAVYTVRDRLARFIREEVRRAVTSEADADEEYEYIMALLASEKRKKDRPQI